MPLIRRDTTVAGVNLRGLFEWMVRQLQYVRFIFPGTGILLGAWSFLLVLAFGAAAALLLGSFLSFETLRPMPA